MTKRKSSKKKNKNKPRVKPHSRNAFFRACVRVFQTLGCCILPQEEDDEYDDYYHPTNTKSVSSLIDTKDTKEITLAPEETPSDEVKTEKPTSQSHSMNTTKDELMPIFDITSHLQLTRSWGSIMSLISLERDLEEKEKTMYPDVEEVEIDWVPVKLQGDEVQVIDENGMRRSWGSIMSLISLERDLEEKEKTMSLDVEEVEIDWAPVKLQGDEVQAIDENGMRRSWGSVMSLISLERDLEEKEKTMYPDAEEVEIDWVPVKLQGDEVQAIDENGMRRSWGSIMSLLSLMASSS